MAKPSIVILGGYGNTGRALARMLLEHTDASLVVCGRSGEKADRQATILNERHPGRRVRGVAADAADRASLLHAFSDADLVVAASSTSALTRNVAETALEAGLDYLDPQYSTRKLDVLRAMAPRIEAAGRCFITEAGFHPGLPAVLVRFAACRIENLRRARVGSVIQLDWTRLEFSPSTIDEMVAEFRDFQSLTFKNGGWQPMSWVESFRPTWMTFSHAFGRRYTMPMFMEEMRALPDMIPGLEETGFFVGGFNWFVDWIVMPLGMAMARISPRAGSQAFGRMLMWGLRGFTRPPYGTLLRLEANGLHQGKEVELQLTVYHADGYVLTVAPIVACLLQVLDGTARRAGLHYQAHVVDPERMLGDMRRMGVEIEVDGPASDQETCVQWDAIRSVPAPKNPPPGDCPLAPSVVTFNPFHGG